jgi:predicted acyltransferase
MRGLIMVLLALEAAGLYDPLSQAAENTPFHTLVQQFSHHPWHGLRAWDLVQPAFMFMAGVAMAFSLERQQKNGTTWNQSFKRTLKRCGWLFFWGVLDYAVRKTGLSFELWDVLTQLSFTTLIAFLIYRWSTAAQIAVCISLLLLTEALYRMTHVPGFDQPFTDQHNFGNYVDLLLMNKINRGGWVAINCIPTSVHTIGGALAGRLLLSHNPRKVARLIGWGAATLLLGYILDWTNITPIIKRIATSSFTIASLGYSLLILAACYWYIDVKDHRRRLQFFTIIGMNSIFIYLFFEIVGHRWFNGYAGAITGGLLRLLNTPALIIDLLTSLVIFACEWSLCYFLYRKKIFFKL